MGHYKLKCSCGYESNGARFGSNAWSTSFFVPVVVDGDKKLHSLEIKMREHESEDDFCARLDSLIELEMIAVYGEHSTSMQAIAIKGGQIVKCLVCYEIRATFVFSGF